MPPSYVVNPTDANALNAINFGAGQSTSQGGLYAPAIGNAPQQQQAAPAGTAGGSNTNPYAALQSQQLGQASQSYNTLFGQTSPQVAQMISLYNQLNGSIDTNTTRARQGLEGQYQGYGQQMTDQFTQSARQLAGQSLARGVGDSSYAGDQYNSASSLYGDQMKNLQNEEGTQLQGLAQGALSEKATNQGYLNSINNEFDTAKKLAGQNTASGYGDASYLLRSLYGEALGPNGIPGLQGKIASYQPGGDLYKSLNQMAPTFNPDILKGKLSDLVTSSAPQFAKDQIASGLIGSNTLADPGQGSYFLNYYKNLMGGAPK